MGLVFRLVGLGLVVGRVFLFVWRLLGVALLLVVLALVLLLALGVEAVVLEFQIGEDATRGFGKALLVADQRQQLGDACPGLFVDLAAEQVDDTLDQVRHRVTGQAFTGDLPQHVGEVQLFFVFLAACPFALQVGNQGSVEVRTHAHQRMCAQCFKSDALQRVESLGAAIVTRPRLAVNALVVVSDT